MLIVSQLKRSILHRIYSHLTCAYFKTSLSILLASVSVLRIDNYNEQQFSSALAFCNFKKPVDGNFHCYYPWKRNSSHSICLNRICEKKRARMSEVPDSTNMSLALSKVLSELGINEDIVSQMRRTWTITETIANLKFRFYQENISLYIFGSQIEGTKTLELKSDADFLFCLNDYRVIRSDKDWKPNVNNLLMVNSLTTSPGYCLLQILRSDAPLPETENNDLHHATDSQGRVLLKTTKLISTLPEDGKQHGPAIAHKAEPGLPPMDVVLAFSCDSLLDSVRHWLSQTKHPWPTEEMKRYIENSPFFVVPIGSRGSAEESLEWRISTSLAERCFMLNLNIVQIQVYVLMKMLLKSRINCYLPEENHISSYMCKTVLLHCIQNSDHSIWRSHMLIQRLRDCLFTLYDCMVKENCPHFIISANNLMAGRFTMDSKRQLSENFHYIFQNFESRGILSLYFGDIADRFVSTLHNMLSGLQCPPDDKECQGVCAEMLKICATTVQLHHLVNLALIDNNEVNDQIVRLQQYIAFLQEIYRNGGIFERSACQLLTPLLLATVGSLMASRSIQRSGRISPKAKKYFSLGLDSDLMSSRLKLVSATYMTGDLNGAEVILRDVENRYEFSVSETICSCKIVERRLLPLRIEAMSMNRNECDIPKLMAFCVIFIPTERSCIPRELEYEMYRSTLDSPSRGRYDHCMDWVVVDSVIFLYFLQYKIYSGLQRRTDKERALDNLEEATRKEPNLGHKETALNLLGQCYEQEHDLENALRCYIASLKLRPRQNLASVLVGCLIYRNKR